MQIANFITITTLALVGFTMAAPVPKSSQDVESRSSSHSGWGTFYYQRGRRGACGKVHSDSSHIVAMAQSHHKKSGCGKKIWIKRAGNHPSITATVVDECPGCSYPNLDLSTGTFDAIGAKRSDGEVKIEWGAY